MRLWRLDRIVSIDLLDRGFARREGFDLSAYAARSFGVFQEAFELRKDAKHGKHQFRKIGSRIDNRLGQRAQARARFAKVAGDHH